MIRYAIYCPLVRREGLEASMPSAAEAWFIKKFGGCTAIDSEGWWRSPTGEVVREPATYVWAWGHKLAPGEFLCFVRELGSHYLQEAVAYELAGEFGVAYLGK